MSFVGVHSSQHLANNTKTPTAYEFPKRKRWADLLVTELVDNIVFVLSPTRTIWFCGAAVTEILGWKETELIDYDFMVLIDATDQIRFIEAFQLALQQNIGFNLTLRLNTNDSALRPKSILCDIKCNPYSIDEEPGKTQCLIAMAVPSPGHNSALLDTIFDLQARQSVLQRRVAELREMLPPESPTALQSSSQTGSMYVTSSLSTVKPPESVPNNYMSSTLLSKSFDGGPRGFGETIDFADRSVYDSHPINVEDPEDGSKKKKLKRAQNSERYVCFTCGSTVSPEWRKGPQGPKTLCNACGLRWAKQMRKAPEDATDKPPAANVGNT
ncbi:Cutinase gene palindrome-binding protein [Psilocybe cubensis]|uniref:Uncharacterized protein n=2 Tax=Psilocybe cubensis TaxID=181762 RepID=A0A8H7Y2E6_PSICU|nr:Cutinase gene palindrome-binding protein [Psilocybe cubensis]KAH9483944.1 Cutinase gene palindrome-binding protein [Psilocybe cubensis]